MNDFIYETRGLSNPFEAECGTLLRYWKSQYHLNELFNDSMSFETLKSPMEVETIIKDQPDDRGINVSIDRAYYRHKWYYMDCLCNLT